MYFDFSTFFLLLRLVVTDKNNPKRFTLHLPLMLVFLVWAMFNCIFLALDFVFFSTFRKQKISQPVFIVGNARSGTTYCHRLMCEDKDRFISFNLWELLLPSIIQQKTIRLFFHYYARFFPDSLQRLAAWEKRQIDDLRKIRPAGMTDPDEDEFIFTFSFASSMLIALFPYITELRYLSTDFEKLPLKTRQRTLEFYKSCVQRLLYTRNKNRTLLSKNPAFVGKMRDLVREFPDAKFVYLYRTPTETIPSVCKLFDLIWQRLGIAEQQIYEGTQSFIEGSIMDYNYALGVINDLPAERCAIVRYEELISNPKTCIEEVYHKLDLPLSDEFSQRLNEEGARQKRFRGANAYSLEEYGISEKELSNRLTPVIRGFGSTDR